MKPICSISFLALSLFGSLVLAQQPGPVPKLINYQGKLVQANGTDPLEAGSYVLRFELFDKAANPAAGAHPQTLVWGEEQQVVVTGGIFHVMLGAPGATPLAGTAVNDLGFAFGSADRFLQTTIVSGPAGAVNQALAPRQQLASVPFAVSAQDAAQAQQSVNSENLAGQPPSFWLPPGMISAYGGSSDPAGWMICDGREVSRTQYPELFAAIGVTFGSGNGSTFNLPDGRGLVLRGSGSRSVNGRTKAGPSIGAIQEDTFQGHGHNLRKTAGGGDSSANAISTDVEQLLFTSNGGTGLRGGSPSARAMFQVNQVGVYGGVFGLNNWCTLEARGPIVSNLSADYGSPRVGNETRVSSIGVNYIIKY